VAESTITKVKVGMFKKRREQARIGELRRKMHLLRIGAYREKGEVSIASKQLLHGIEPTHFHQLRKLRSEVRKCHLAIKPVINDDFIRNDYRIEGVIEWINMAELCEKVADYFDGPDPGESPPNSLKSPPENTPLNPPKAVDTTSPPTKQLISPTKQLKGHFDAASAGRNPSPSKAAMIHPSPPPQSSRRSLYSSGHPNAKHRILNSLDIDVMNRATGAEGDKSRTAMQGLTKEILDFNEQRNKPTTVFLTLGSTNTMCKKS
jgi:hypothetical protein